MIADVDVFMLIFRIVHIGAGVAWAGSVFLFVLFIQPSVAAIAPAGAPFMAELLGKRKLVNHLLTYGATTIVGGLVLYLRDMDQAGGFGNWIDSSYGLALTLGALAAIIGFSVGLFGTRPRVQRLLAVGQEIAAAGGPPAPELAAEAQQLQVQLKVFARVTLGLIAVAVLLMATAESW